MTGPAFHLSDAQRVERYELLREATTLREPPVVTEADLRRVPELAATESVAGAAGAGEFLDTTRRSNVQVQVEVAAGDSVRVWEAWLGYASAIVLAQPSPAIRTDDTPDGIITGRQPPVVTGYSLRKTAPGWVPVDAMRWLGFRSAADPAGSCRLPLPALLRRLADPRDPPPHGDPGLGRIWSEPMQMCAVTARPADERVLLLDAGGAGVWTLDTEDEGAVALTRISPRAIWRLFLALTISTMTTRPGGAEQL
jgi:hypothetical protein